MPVLVTGAEEAVGRDVVQRLARLGGEVRVFLDLERPRPADPGPFAALGCKVARGALDDEGHLETALEQVHTVLHLAASPLDEPERLLDATATVLAAAIGAGCRRLVWLSSLRAEAADGNPWLAACAEAEELLAEAPLESVVFRRALTYGPGDELTAALAAGAAGGLGAGGGAAKHAPLFAGDLAGAVLAADRDRVASGPSDLHLIVPIAGPDVLDLVAVVRGLRGSPQVPARPGLPEYTADLLSRDLLPPPGAIGAQGTPFAEGVRRL